MTINQMIRGNITASNTQGSITATISTVNMAKSIVDRKGAQGLSTPWVRVELSTSNAITAIHSTGNGSTTVGYQIMELV